jgi:hypothetical protein
MATIAINGVTLLPQPANDVWKDAVIDGVLNGTEAVGAYKIFRMQAPALAGQPFNWDNFENRVLTSLQAYAPGDVPTGANVVYSAGVVSKKISRYQSPLDRSVTGVELVVQVIIDEGS